jgi:hypothetical protein
VTGNLKIPWLDLLRHEKTAAAGAVPTKRRENAVG